MAFIRYFAGLVSLGCLATCVPEARPHHDDSRSQGGERDDPSGGSGSGAKVSVSLGGADDGGSPPQSNASGGGRDDAGAGPVSEPPLGEPGVGGAGPLDDGLTGRWQGLTSQGRLIHFDVFEGAVLRVEVDWEVDVPVEGALCVARGAVATELGKPAAIGAGGVFAFGPLSGPPITYSVKGKIAAGSATGQVSVSHPTPGCDGDAELTFVAERQICGDGHLTWPETCDPQDPLRSKGCTSICQLSPIPEQEPNNAPGPSLIKVDDDAVLSGSLAAGDTDVFAIHNALAGTVAVELEVHSETVGTCTVNDGLADTLLEVIDASSKVLSTDDDGSRSWFCSQLARQLSSGQTLYVRLTSPDGKPIPTYNLHVKFQKA